MSEHVTWVTWSPRGRDPYTNPRSNVAHAAPVSPESRGHADGGYPLACGRRAPDSHDAIFVQSPYTRRCRACERALAAKPA